eukprot:828638-Pleurochrysis_carterae.AAC.1
MTERHVSKYVLSTRGNSCDSFFGFAEAHEVTEAFVKLVVAIERYLEPKNLVVDFNDCSSDSTFSDNDAGSSAEVPELAPGSADAEPSEEAGASSVSPYARWARAVAESEEYLKDMQALMDAIEALTKLNKASCLVRNSLSAKSKFLSGSTRSDKC